MSVGTKAKQTLQLYLLANKHSLKKPSKKPKCNANASVPFTHIFCFWEGHTILGKRYSSFRALVKLQLSHKHTYESVSVYAIH